MVKRKRIKEHSHRNTIYIYLWMEGKKVFQDLNNYAKLSHPFEDLIFEQGCV